LPVVTGASGDGTAATSLCAPVGRAATGVAAREVRHRRLWNAAASPLFQSDVHAPQGEAMKIVEPGIVASSQPGKTEPFAFTGNGKE
jgi:hypothetical protein